jgi:ABC-type transport system involved in cytochrome bd biosynthesis fused ATPase/permease subunit
MTVAAVAGWLAVAAGAGLLMTSAWLIGQAALRPSIAALQVSIVGVRFFSLSRSVCRYLERLTAHDATLRLLGRLRVGFYRAVEPLAPAGLEGHRQGDLLARVVADVDTLQGFYLQVLRPPLVALPSMALMAGLLGWYEPRLAGLLVLAWALVAVGIPWLTRPLGRDLGSRLIQTRAELHVLLVDQVRGIADLLVHGAADDHQRRVARCSGTLLGLRRRSADLAALHEALGGLTVQWTALAAVALAVPLVRQQVLEGPALVVIAVGVLAAFEAVLPLPDLWRTLAESRAAATRLFGIAGVDRAEVGPRSAPIGGSPGSASDEAAAAAWFEAAAAPGSDRDPHPTRPLLPAEVAPRWPVPGGSSPGPVSPPDLVLEGIGFAYPGRGPILDQVSLTVSAGQRVALVGASGSGKSTLFHLLLRFRAPARGRVLVNGQDLSERAPEAARAWFSVLSQGSHLFGATVRENLLLARPQATDEELEAACCRAGIDEVIRALPQGYDTWIGEQGVNLSAGEAQRLALARTLLQDGPILLLDEPTARLDPFSVQRVHQGLLAASAGRTTLWITHRLNGLAAVDRICVLANGRVAETGTHAELLTRPQGQYRRLWDLQRQAAVLATSPLDGVDPGGRFETDRTAPQGQQGYREDESC